jgi:hypothetical protein
MPDQMRITVEVEFWGKRRKRQNRYPTNTYHESPSNRLKMHGCRRYYRYHSVNAWGTRITAIAPITSKMRGIPRGFLGGDFPDDALGVALGVPMEDLFLVGGGGDSPPKSGNN